MAKNEGMEKHEEFKAEFKKRVKEQAKMLYRKSLDEISDRHKFVCVACVDSRGCVSVCSRNGHVKNK